MKYLITLMVTRSTFKHPYVWTWIFAGDDLMARYIFLSTAKISIPLWNVNGIPVTLESIYIYIYILRLYFWIRWFQRNTSWRVYTSGIRFHGTKGKIFPSWLTFRGSSQARIGEYSCSPLWNVRGNATHETQIHCSWHSRISLPSSLSSLSLSLSLSIHRWTLKAVTTGWERHR